MTSARKSSRILSLLAGVAFVTCAAPAFATTQLAPNVALDTELRAQAGDVNNADLGTGTLSDNTAAGALEANFKLTADLNTKTLLFVEARGVGSVGRGGFESADTGTLSHGDSFLEWRQSYFQFSDVGDEHASVRFGRQRLRDPYGIWWNEDQDALRASYDTTLFKGFVAAGQNLSSYQTGPDTFLRDDRDLARVLGEGSYQYYYDNFLEGRLLYQDDHSNASIGDVNDNEDLDRGTGNLVWEGLRATGKSHALASGDQKTLYRLDVMAVEGHEDSSVFTDNGDGTSTITGLNGQHVFGWGLDGALDVPVPAFQGALVHLGYAYGSGDHDAADSTDHAFRQSGLQGNFSRIGALSENTDDYGTVLRPELSNIHIFAAGVTAPVLKASDVGAIYRYYRLADDATSITSSGIENALNGHDKDLGQGVDLLFNMDLLKETDSKFGGVQDAALRTSLGFFTAGDAYGAGSGDTAVRGLVEVKVGF